jgi:signal transduction histidine kinase
MGRKAVGMSSGQQRTKACRVMSKPGQILAAVRRSPVIGFATFDHRLKYETINRSLAAMNGLPATAHLGKTVRDILGAAAVNVEHIFRNVFQTGKSVREVEISMELATRKEIGHWIESYFPIKDATGKVKQVAVLVVEITEQKKLRESLRCLAGKVLRLKDVEQRRVAREIHDSVDQYHAALKMNLGSLGQCESEDERAKLLESSVELLNECIEETRTICHLLHPPLLDLLGFKGAVREYVRVFAKRSGIHVKLKLPSRLLQLPDTVQISLFRVLQESLTNAYRHSQTSLIIIEMVRKDDQVKLSIRDFGRGIPPKQLQRLQQIDASASVGLAGIRERIHDLGGQFEINSGKTGTRVSVALPVSSEKDTAHGYGVRPRSQSR